MRRLKLLRKASAAGGHGVAVIPVAGAEDVAAADAPGYIRSRRTRGAGRRWGERQHFGSKSQSWCLAQQKVKRTRVDGMSRDNRRGARRNSTADPGVEVAHAESAHKPEWIHLQLVVRFSFF
jgi:hypothetical protein